jgi:hypothetical protein
MIDISYSSIRLKTPFFALRILHSGQRQVSGTSSQRGSRSYTIFGIAFQRIIDSMAFVTYASCPSCRLRHGLFNSKDIAGCILFLF